MREERDSFYPKDIISVFLICKKCGDRNEYAYFNKDLKTVSSKCPFCEHDWDFQGRVHNLDQY